MHIQYNIFNKFMINLYFTGILIRTNTPKQRVWIRILSGAIQFYHGQVKHKSYFGEPKMLTTSVTIHLKDNLNQLLKPSKTFSTSTCEVKRWKRRNRKRGTLTSGLRLYPFVQIAKKKFFFWKNVLIFTSN